MANEYLVKGESLTAVADKIRILNGSTETMSIDEMATNVGVANSEVDSQTELLAQAVAALEGKASGGSGVDVTASVGQTIIVEEVDASGKPTKWKAADYQPRTHWSEFADTVLIDNQSYGEYDEVFLDFALAAGQSYHIVFNGAEYDEVARSVNADGMVYVALGDGAMFGEESTGEPYTFVYVEGYGTMPATNGGGDYTISLSTVQEIVHKMPDKYMPEFRPYTLYIVEDGDGYFALASVEAVETAFSSGREINGVISRSADTFCIPLFLVAYSQNGKETEYGKVLVLRDLYVANLLFKLTPQEDGTYAVTKVKI